MPDGPVGDSFLHQLSTSGPMARSIRDLVLLLQVIGVPDARLPHSVAAFESLPDVSTLKGLTIGWVGDWGGYYPMDPEVLELCENGLEQMRGLGASIKTLHTANCPRTAVGGVDHAAQLGDRQRASAAVSQPQNP